MTRIMQWAAVFTQIHHLLTFAQVFSFSLYNESKVEEISGRRQDTSYANISAGVSPKQYHFLIEPQYHDHM